MTYKMYLLDIHDLEDKSLSDKAMALIDDKRREIANKYCKEKDRLRAIAAGLLLQVGFGELEPTASVCVCEKMEKGICYKMQAKAMINWLLQGSNEVLPIPLKYNIGEHGKPSWDKDKLESINPRKKLWHFNLSHSGDYVVLVVADVEVGVDIQEDRVVKHFPGGYKAFSRMEAFVKCTGDGIARGQEIYRKYNGEIPGYEMQQLYFIEQYILNVCLANGNKYKIG